MVFRWIYSVTLFFFTVQGGLILRPTQSEENSHLVSATGNPEWFEQLNSIRQGCIDDVCKSAAENLQRDCLAGCLRHGLQNSPVVRKARKTFPTDVMTSNDPEEREALKACLRDQCQRFDYRPKFFSRCIFEKCFGLDSRLYPDSEEPRRSEAEESGSVDQISSDEQNEEWQREQKQAAQQQEDCKGKPADSVRPYRRISSIRKRGYTDATDICIAYHCSGKPRGTFGFLKCVNDNRCAGR